MIRVSSRFYRGFVLALGLSLIFWAVLACAVYAVWKLL